jgi:uncharacterized membrane protein YcaP (DUF421 family)
MPQWLEVILRTLSAVLILFFFTKMLGKRQVTHLSPFDYITGITIGGLAAYISLDLDVTWYSAIIALSVWVGVSLAIEFIQIKSKKLRDFIDGKATILIKHGKILEANLRKEKLTVDELLQQLRKKNVFNVIDVEFAIMEPSGDISVLLIKEKQPLTSKDLGLKGAPQQEPQIVIAEGKVWEEPLNSIGLDRNWLNKEIDKLGVTIKDVFLGQVDTHGFLFIDLYDDHEKNNN